MLLTLVVVFFSAFLALALSLAALKNIQIKKLSAHFSIHCTL